jgi:mRNA interferase YafQ
MSYIPAYTAQFKKDVSILEKQQKDMKKLLEVTDLLLSGKNLPARFHPSKLNDNFKNHMECKIEPDWILIYKLEGREVIFERTGTSYELYN